MHSCQTYMNTGILPVLLSSGRIKAWRYIVREQAAALRLLPMSAFASRYPRSFMYYNPFDRSCRRRSVNGETRAKIEEG